MQDTKGAPRIRDPILLRLLKHEYDCCELSGVTNGLHLHHVIFRSHQGSDVRENIICLSEDVHTLYHSGDPETRLLVARHIEQKRPDVARYIAEKLGSQDALLEWYSRHGNQAVEGRMT